MLTAFQEQKSQQVHCTVLVGEPARTKKAQNGPVRLFKPGQVVLYGISQKSQSRRIQGYLVRVGKGVVRVPGVYPAVTVLVHAQRRGHLTRLRRAISWLRKQGYNIDSLSDKTYAKINSLIAARDFRVLHLKQVLNHENE